MVRDSLRRKVLKFCHFFAVSLLHQCCLCLCSNEQSTKVFIGNLTPDCTRSQLMELFAKHGSVVECDIISDYAFVVGGHWTWTTEILSNCLKSSDQQVT